MIKNWVNVDPASKPMQRNSADWRHSGKFQVLTNLLGEMALRETAGIKRGRKRRMGGGWEVENEFGEEMEL